MEWWDQNVTAHPLDDDQKSMLEELFKSEIPDRLDYWYYESKEFY